MRRRRRPRTFPRWPSRRPIRRGRRRFPVSTRSRRGACFRNFGQDTSGFGRACRTAAGNVRIAPDRAAQRAAEAIVAVLIALLCLFPWAKDIYALLAAPLLQVLPQGSTMIATDVTGTFLVPLKVTLMAAFLIALPYVLYQMWAFVAPGLYKHERRLMVPLIVSSMVFFLLGMAFAYFLVFPWVFAFFVSYTPTGVQMMTDIDKYLSSCCGCSWRRRDVRDSRSCRSVLRSALRRVDDRQAESVLRYVIVGASSSPT
jgi:hypothetical protein